MSERWERDKIFQKVIYKLIYTSYLGTVQKHSAIVYYSIQFWVYWNKYFATLLQLYQQLQKFLQVVCAIMIIVTLLTSPIYPYKMEISTMI